MYGLMSISNTTIGLEYSRKVYNFKSERQDLNLRPPQPHCGALPGCATLRTNYFWIIFNIASKSSRIL